MFKKIISFLLSISLVLSFLGNVTLAEEKEYGTLVAGGFHSFQIKTDGSLWGWGVNGQIDGYAYLGDGTSNYRAFPVKIMDDVKSVTTGYECTFIIQKNGSLWGVGRNLPGLLNQGENEFQLAPKKIMDNVEKIALNDGMEDFNRGALILKTDGSLWISGWDGQSIQSEPKQIMTDVKDIFAYINNYHAIKTDGSLYVWGDAYERIANSQAENKSIPVKVMDGVMTSTAGLFITFAVKEDGSLWGFGYNYNGMLKDIDHYAFAKEDLEVIATPVKITEDVLPQIGERAGRLYYLKEDNSLWRLRENMIFVHEGGETETIYTKEFEKIMEGVEYFNTNMSSNIFIVKKDGTLWLDGVDNSYAQMGDGTANMKFSPVALEYASDLENAEYSAYIALKALTGNTDYWQIDADNFLRYMEECISVYASAKSEKLINKELVDSLKAEVDEIRASIDYYIDSEPIYFFREMKNGVSLVTDENLEINIDPSVLDAAADIINVKNGNLGIAIQPDNLKAEFSDGESIGISLKAIDERRFEIKIDRESLNMPIKVQVPVTSDMLVSRLYIEDAAGDYVPSMYNSANGKLEFKVTSSGVYTIHENLNTIKDMEDLNMQMSITYLTLKGILHDDFLVEPELDKPLTRGELANLISRALGIYDPNAVSEFKDVTADNSHYRGISSAKKFGIVAGMSDDYFKPDEPVKRVELAAICARAIGLAFDYETPEYPEEYLDFFTDSDSIPQWARMDLSKALRDGIFGPEFEDSFNPNGSISRKDFSIILSRLYKLSW